MDKIEDYIKDDGKLDVELIRDMLKQPKTKEEIRREKWNRFKNWFSLFSPRRLAVRFLLYIISKQTLILMAIIPSSPKVEEEKEISGESIHLDELRKHIKLDPVGKPSLWQKIKSKFQKDSPKTYKRSGSTDRRNDLDDFSDIFITAIKRQSDKDVNRILEEIKRKTGIHVAAIGSEHDRAKMNVPKIKTQKYFDRKLDKKNLARKTDNKYYPLIKKGQLWSNITDSEIKAKVIEVKQGKVKVLLNKGRKRSKIYLSKDFYDVYTKKGRFLPESHIRALQNQFSSNVNSYWFGVWISKKNKKTGLLVYGVDEESKKVLTGPVNFNTTNKKLRPDGFKNKEIKPVSGDIKSFSMKYLKKNYKKDSKNYVSTKINSRVV